MKYPNEILDDKFFKAAKENAAFSEYKPYLDGFARRVSRISDKLSSDEDDPSAWQNALDEEELLYIMKETEDMAAEAERINAGDEITAPLRAACSMKNEWERVFRKRFSDSVNPGECRVLFGGPAEFNPFDGCQTFGYGECLWSDTSEKIIYKEDGLWRQLRIDEIPLSYSNGSDGEPVPVREIVRNCLIGDEPEEDENDDDANDGLYCLKAYEGADLIYAGTFDPKSFSETGEAIEWACNILEDDEKVRFVLLGDGLHKKKAIIQEFDSGALTRYVNDEFDEEKELDDELLQLEEQFDAFAETAADFASSHEPGNITAEEWSTAADAILEASGCFERAKALRDGRNIFWRHKKTKKADALIFKMQKTIKRICQDLPEFHVYLSDFGYRNAKDMPQAKYEAARRNVDLLESAEDLYSMKKRALAEAAAGNNPMPAVYISPAYKIFTDEMGADYKVRSMNPDYGKAAGSPRITACHYIDSAANLAFLEYEKKHGFADREREEKEEDYRAVLLAFEKEYGFV